MSYNTDSLPTTVPSDTPDSTTYQDRAGIPDRMIPIDINAAKISRVQSANLKMTLQERSRSGASERTQLFM